ncbi:hypothetical protein, partial [Massilia mucilaginosa]|uniref:hypothetical protein n=1 Tax=Massilia mucilaginosa TaxID=2609282 RepID=UPI001CB6FCEB
IAATCFSQKTVVFSMLAPVSNRSSKNAEIRISQQVWGLWSAYVESNLKALPGVFKALKKSIFCPMHRKIV